VKKAKEDKNQRRLTLSRETIQRLENRQLEQVQGGTSQWVCTTRTGTNYNEIASNGC
jgi:hypothetical protein